MYGHLGKHPDVKINYEKWGKAGDLSIIKANQEDSQFYINHIMHMVDLSQFVLRNAALVQHYQGKYMPANVIWLRFEPDNVELGNIGGVHISATIDVETKKLKGFVRMLPELNNPTCISHQQALETAIAFLREYAPDLICSKQEFPLLNKFSNESRVEFLSPYLNYDQVQLRWIGKHNEILFKTKQVVSGIKVKMYLPQNALWCWVIVDQLNQVMAFERDVSWDFLNMQRNTQMWLHDGWLKKTI